MNKNKHKRKTSYEKSLSGYIWGFWICLFLTGSLIWGTKNFGAISMEEIVFTLSMSLDGSGSGFISSFIWKVLVPGLVILIAAQTILFVAARKKKAARAADAAPEAPSGESVQQAALVGEAEAQQTAAEVQEQPAENAVKAEVQTEPSGESEAQAEPSAKAEAQAALSGEAEGRKPGKICRYIMRITMAVWAIGLVVAADAVFGVFGYVKNQLSTSSFIQDHYIDPGQVQLTFPENKRNLIWILMESGESSAQDVEHGGLFQENYIPEMTQIAEENVSFSQSDKIEGALLTAGSTWTVGGMVSQFGGVPLKVMASGMNNRMDEFETFMPGMTNLGDILQQQGYHNYFMIGSKAGFGGRDHLMEQHGDYEIWDYDTAIEKGKIPEDYYVWWGYEDQKLYEYAKEELTRISAQDEPFNFTMLTVDTHHVDGWKCPLCPDTYDTQYANVWACASRQVNDFINWCKEQPFYENTTIIISGDHCSMDPNFYAQFPAYDENGLSRRKVYNAFVNSAAQPVQEKNRKFTTLDMFPSALAAMGVEIEGNRLGIGTNLFSEKQTLCEEYGYHVMFKEMGRTSEFYNKQLLFPDKKAARQKPAA